jgi:hypothetical protein
MSKDSKAYLQHILSECDFIVSVIKTETTKEEFLRDEILKKSCG